MKRANGTGSVVKLSGNRRRPYAVRVSSRDKYNQIVQHTLSYHATAKEAQLALDEYNRLRAAGQAPDPNKLEMTVQQIYDAWSARAYKKVGPHTIKCYRSAWNKRISRFANRKMRSVTLDEWQSILDEDEALGMSQSTVKNDVILIKAFYSYAMERDIVGKDYSQFLDIPSIEAKKQKGSFSDTQIAQLEQMAAAGTPWADTVLILCYTGFRITEFLTLTKFSYHSEEGGYLQGGIKTDAGKNRIVPVHPKIAPYIDSFLANDTEYLITNEGKPISASYYRTKYFPPIADALGCPQATPHWCRHTFATRLHNAGADPLTTKWLLGHSTKGDVTNRYTHATISNLVKEIRKLA